MIDQSYSSLYQTLTDRIDKTIAACAQGEMGEIATLQTYLTGEVFPRTGEDLPQQKQGLWRSLHQELYRSSRLLQVEGLRYQSARQTAIREERQQQLLDRLGELQRHSQALVALIAQGEERD
jgi:transposase InsO family protein